MVPDKKKRMNFILPGRIIFFKLLQCNRCLVGNHAVAYYGYLITIKKESW